MTERYKLRDIKRQKTEQTQGETKIARDSQINKSERDRHMGRKKWEARARGPETESETARKDREGETETWPCDAADLTGLGLSAAVPLAFVHIAGENSIPV